MRIVALSGLAEKASACFLVELGARRLLLDAGAGVPLARLGNIADALLISHQHPDHIGAVGSVPDIPIWATPPVAAEIERRHGRTCHPLPLRGTTGFCDVTVTTGRDGHAPGGVWLHLRHGRDTLLYMGDHSQVCPLFPFDPPPPAETAIIDASYGFAEADKSAESAALMARLAAGPTVLPLPAAGRGLEILATAVRHGVPVPAIDPAIRASGRAALAEPDVLAPDWAPLLVEALDRAPDADPYRLAAGATLWSDTQLTEPRSRPLIAAVESGIVEAVLTGYVIADTPAAALLARGLARRMDWTIHPTLAENRALLRAVGAVRCLPAFFDSERISALGDALGVPPAFPPLRSAAE